MTRQIVRNFGANMTHLADVRSSNAAVAFGAHYAKPDPKTTYALCGVHIKDGVVMRPGTKLRCSSCRRLGEMSRSITDDIDRDEVHHMIEIQGIYDGWSIMVLKDGRMLNRWENPLGRPTPGDERRWVATAEAIENYLAARDEAESPGE